MNKDNNKYEAKFNDVRYVNTKYDKFITMMSNEHVRRLNRARFIRSMMKDENFKQALCADWPKYLEGLIDLFNDEIKDECPIKNAWDTSIGKIIKEFVDFIYDNVVYICELRQEEDVTFTIKVNKQHQLELLLEIY